MLLLYPQRTVLVTPSVESIGSSHSSESISSLHVTPSVLLESFIVGLQRQTYLPQPHVVCVAGRRLNDLDFLRNVKILERLYKVGGISYFFAARIYATQYF